MSVNVYDEIAANTRKTILILCGFNYLLPETKEKRRIKLAKKLEDNRALKDDEHIM
jgi:hypothetical protein